MSRRAAIFWRLKSLRVPATPEEYQYLQPVISERVALRKIQNFRWRSPAAPWKFEFSVPEELKLYWVPYFAIRRLSTINASVRLGFEKPRQPLRGFYGNVESCDRYHYARYRTWRMHEAQFTSFIPCCCPDQRKSYFTKFQMDTHLRAAGTPKISEPPFPGTSVLPRTKTFAKDAPHLLAEDFDLSFYQVHQLSDSSEMNECVALVFLETVGPSDKTTVETLNLGDTTMLIDLVHVPFYVVETPRKFSRSVATTVNAITGEIGGPYLRSPMMQSLVATAAWNISSLAAGEPDAGNELLNFASTVTSVDTLLIGTTLFAASHISIDLRTWLSTDRRAQFPSSIYAEENPSAIQERLNSLQNSAASVLEASLYLAKMKELEEAKEEEDVKPVARQESKPKRRETPKPQQQTRVDEKKKDTAPKLDEEQLREWMARKARESSNANAHTEQQFHQSSVVKTTVHTDEKGYYEVMGLKGRENCSVEMLQAAWVEMAKQYHPDLQRTEEEKARARTIFILLNEAHSVLCDREKRLQYDQKCYRVRFMQR